jgi:hypothetical protein
MRNLCRVETYCYKYLKFELLILLYLYTESKRPLTLVDSACFDTGHGLRVIAIYPDFWSVLCLLNLAGK